jgi:anti-sigma-K factor RskA
MTTPDDIDALAAEYVLGTLDLAERTAVSARRLREPALDTAIKDWEERLAPLDAIMAPVEPPAGVLAAIEHALNSGQRAGWTVVELDTLRRRVKLWQRIGVAASAIAASLIVAIGLRETVYRPPLQQFVGVFQKDDVLPSFYLTIDLDTRELTIRPVDARRTPGKTYQLWIASDQLGPTPQSLGLVDDDLAPTRKSLPFDRQLLQRATYGVSLEPAGGSPTGRPTAPALHTKLLPVAG